MRHENTAYERSKHPYPAQPSDIIAFLADLCPEPVVIPGMSAEQIMFLAGRRSVWRDAVDAYEKTFARPGDN